MKYPQTTIAEKIDYQIEYLGYIDIVDKQYKGMAVVLEVDTQYSPKLRLYALANGNVVECKIEKRIYNRHAALYKKDIVRILGQEIKPRARRNELGEWEPIPNTREIWIKDYKKVVI